MNFSFGSCAKCGLSVSGGTNINGYWYHPHCFPTIHNAINDALLSVIENTNQEYNQAIDDVIAKIIHNGWLDIEDLKRKIKALKK